jgi:hypothetical protein
MTQRARRTLAWSLATTAAALLTAAAAAQTFDAARPRTLVVGTPPGARADRIDGARTGAVRDPLPLGGLRVAWQTPVAALIDDAPLVDASGSVYVVGTRGEVVVVGPDGIERWRVSTGAVQPGPAALLSDDTLVFADAVGEAVAVRDGAVRWRTRFGRGDIAHPAPLPLADGGVVVATAHDLAVLDAEGHERARTTLPEAADGPLVAFGRKVVVTGASGVVWTWAPGAPEPERIGSLGGAPEGGAVLIDDHTLVAVTAGGRRLSSLDLGQPGQPQTFGQLGQLGQPLAAVTAGAEWLGPPASHAGNVYLMLDRSGVEIMRARVASRLPVVTADGGSAPLLPVPHAAPLVDASGTIAFAGTDGAVGTVGGATGAATVEMLQGVCAGAARLPAGDALHVAGLAPLPLLGGAGAGAGFVAACHAGSVVALRGATPAGESAPGHL